MERKGCSVDGFTEHDEAAIWVALIANHLGKNAMVVPDGTLKQKTTFINSWSNVGDLAIEVHFGDESGNGSESRYQPGRETSKNAAQRLQEALSGVFGSGRGACEGWYRNNRKMGVEWFLEKTRCEAVIIEPEHIYNQDIIQKRRNRACRVVAETLMEIDNV